MKDVSMLHQNFCGKSQKMRYFCFLLEVVRTPERSKVACLIQRFSLFLRLGARCWDDVIDVPKVHVVPTHARQELALNVGAKFSDRAPKNDFCLRQLLEAFRLERTPKQ